MDNETDFIKKLIPTFEIHFNVTTEVWSECKTKRIDLILTHKQNKDISFGIECKLPDKKRGEKIGEYVKQAINYTKLNWYDGSQYRKLPILLCPPLSYKYFVLNEHQKIFNNETWVKDRHNQDDKHHSFNGFLGAFNVGEVRKSKYGYYFVMSNKLMFGSFNKNSSIRLDNYNSIIKKINK